LLKQSKWYQEKENTAKNKIYEFGTNRIHMETYWVESKQGEFRLTEQEMKLLQIFVNGPEKIISKKRILKEGWGYSDQMETRTLDIFMTRLRKYFEEDHKEPKHFISLRNKGIIFYPNPHIKG
jgi:DNA-binding response OmpR family regulator